MCLPQVLLPGTAAWKKRFLYSHNYSNKKHKQFLFVLLLLVKDNQKDIEVGVQGIFVKDMLEVIPANMLESSQPF